MSTDPFFAIAADDQNAATLDTLRAVAVFLRDHIIAPPPSKQLPHPKKIAARLLIFEAMLYPQNRGSLASIARQLRCSRAWLTKLGNALTKGTGLRGAWQRMKAREVYRARARGVHRGTWVSTERHQRRRLRERGHVRKRTGRR